MRRRIRQTDEGIEQADCTSGEKNVRRQYREYFGRRIIEEDNVFRCPQSRDNSVVPHAPQPCESFPAVPLFRYRFAVIPIFM